MISDAVILSTADLAAPTSKPERAVTRALPEPMGLTDTAPDVERLAPLFQPYEAQDFRAAWDTVQIGFLDDPKQAERKADELVAQVLKTLAKSFATERSRLESQVDPSADHASTKHLRVALRRLPLVFFSACCRCRAGPNCCAASSRPAGVSLRDQRRPKYPSRNKTMTTAPTSQMIRFTIVVLGLR